MFSCEFCDISKNTFFTEHLWATASAQIYPEKIVNYFSVKSCLRTVVQHYTGKFLVKFWLRHIKATLHMVFSCEKMTISRSSRSQMFFKIGTFANCAIFTGKHLCWSFSLIKLLVFRPATLLKRDSNADVFLCMLRNVCAYCDI